MKTFVRIAALAALSILLLIGCTQTKVSDVSGTEPPRDVQEQQMSREQMQLLREILKYQKESGQELLSVLKDLESQKTTAQAAREHPVVQNIAVARELCARAKETTDSKKRASLLHRLRFVLTDIYTELPASRMIAHLERARLALGEGEPTDEQISAASGQVMAALESGMGVEPADFVPPVLTRLESAKEELDSDNAAAARMLIIEAQRQAAGHKLNGVTRKATAAARGAEEALNRQADAVVEAELSVVESMLDELYLVAGPEEEAESEEEAAAEQTETTEAEQTPPAEEGQEPPPSEEAAPQEPAETEPMPDEEASQAEEAVPESPASRSATHR